MAYSRVSRESIHCFREIPQAEKHATILPGMTFQNLFPALSLPVMEPRNSQDQFVTTHVSNGTIETDISFLAAPRVELTRESPLHKFHQKQKSKDALATITYDKWGNLHASLTLYNPPSDIIDYMWLYTSENFRESNRLMEVHMTVKNGECHENIVQMTGGAYKNNDYIDLIVADSPDPGGPRYFIVGQEGQPPFQISEEDVVLLGFPLPDITFENGKVTAEQDGVILIVDSNSLSEDFPNRLGNGQLVLDMVAKRGDIDLLSEEPPHLQ